MKYKLRIGEFANLKNVTTETLRHYDRVGLLKPMEIDEETGYRYYSVFQSGKLATIIELKALGFSIEEMKLFFEGRQLSQTHDMLKDKHEALVCRIASLQHLEESLNKKLTRLSDMMKLESGERYIIRTEAPKQIAFLEERIKNSVDFEWAASLIENQLIDIHPVIGGNYGLLIPKDTFLCGQVFGASHMIYFLDSVSGVDEDLLKVLPEQRVACFHKSGLLMDADQVIEELIQQLHADGYEITGNVIIRVLVSSTATDVIEEQGYEVLVPINP